MTRFLHRTVEHAWILLAVVFALSGLAKVAAPAGSLPRVLFGFGDGDFDAALDDTP